MDLIIKQLKESVGVVLLNKIKIIIIINLEFLQINNNFLIKEIITKEVIFHKIRNYQIHNNKIN